VAEDVYQCDEGAAGGRPIGCVAIR
jgi:hypothetical protein